MRRYALQKITHSQKQLSDTATERLASVNKQTRSWWSLAGYGYFGLHDESSGLILNRSLNSTGRLALRKCLHCHREEEKNGEQQRKCSHGLSTARRAYSLRCP